MNTKYMKRERNVNKTIGYAVEYCEYREIGVRRLFREHNFKKNKTDYNDKVLCWRIHT